MTITAGASVITPLLVTGFESERAGGTVVHRIPGRVGGPDVTLRPASLQEGTLELLLPNETTAAAAVAALSAATTAVFATDELTTLGFTFVVPEGGRIRRALDDTTRRLWRVSVDFQEITP